MTAGDGHLDSSDDYDEELDDLDADEDDEDLDDGHDEVGAEGNRLVGALPKKRPYSRVNCAALE